MERTRKPTPTKAIIIKKSAELIFKNGFSKTTATEVCKLADISKGNLTYYFPTKEDLLALLVQMMIDFQWKEMENTAGEGKNSILSYCLELTIFIAMGEEFFQMRDCIEAAYSSPITLDRIRSNDIPKIKQVFSAYTSDWDDARFFNIGNIILGIEYATFIHTEHIAPIEDRIKWALDSIMMLFGISEELRNVQIQKVLSMNYRQIGRDVYEKFKQYVLETNGSVIDNTIGNIS